MGEAVAKEPSMEEILSSIRKIITDDGTSKQNNGEVAPATKPDIQIASVTSDAPAEAVVNKARPSIENTAETASQIESSPSEIPTADNVETAVEVSAEPIIQVVPEIVETVQSVTTELDQVDIPADSVQGEASSPEPEIQIASEPAVAQADLTSIPATSPIDSIAPQEITEAKPMEEAMVAEETPDIQSEPVVAEPEPITASTETIADATSDTPEASGFGDGQIDEATIFKGALMSPSTDQIVSEAFERLQRETMENIEGKTESILRPMLSEWLDNNLPTLVERLVREEIERVSRGR